MSATCYQLPFGGYHMSDHLTAEVPADAAPYASLEELKEEHSTLLRRRRDGFDDNPSAFLGEVETFRKRGCATGSILGDPAERYAAQSLLTYWSNVLYREGREAPRRAWPNSILARRPNSPTPSVPTSAWASRKRGSLLAPAGIGSLTRA